MKWNWQKQDWGNFTYNKDKLGNPDNQFLSIFGESIGILKHTSDDTKQKFKIELIADEALTTSSIEGEILNRSSVQSSICNQFGIIPEIKNIPDKEFGISSVMFDLYENHNDLLTEQKLFYWHQLLFTGNMRIKGGEYRKTDVPMQVVSGSLGKRKIHFEAPPTKQVKSEMQKFLNWFNSDNKDMPVIIKAGIAHLYFECIHPFEDGNGRIGRAIIEKAISLEIGKPSLMMLSYTIEKNKKEYYNALEQANKQNDVTEWLVYFIDLVNKSQQHTMNRIDFIIKKTKLYDTCRDKLNNRQQKVLDRIFIEGYEGFKGGLSAKNYIAITQAPTATATRDLSDMVKKGVLTKQGQLKHTRYYLNI